MARIGLCPQTLLPVNYELPMMAVYIVGICMIATRQCRLPPAVMRILLPRHHCHHRHRDSLDHIHMFLSFSFSTIPWS